MGGQTRRASFIVFTDHDGMPEDRVQTNPIAWTQPILNRK